MLEMSKMTNCTCNDKHKLGFPGKVRSVVNGYTRVITFSPGYRCEKPRTDGGSHGIGSADVIFILSNRAGVVQFRLMAGWYPRPPGTKEWESWPKEAPMPSDLGYHSPKPMYDDQMKMAEAGECPWMEEGQECYYDGSTLNAARPFEILVNEGEEALWSFLESYHRGRFA